MATSGKINGTVTNTNKSNIFSFYANWSATQNIDENASYVTVTTYFSTNNTGYKFDTVGNRDASITVNGKKYSVSKRMTCNPWNDSKTYVIQTVSRHKVLHGDDGKKKITISATVYADAGKYGPALSGKPCKLSAEIELDEIPRYAKVLTAPNFTDNDSPTITYGNALGDKVTSLEACISLDGGATATVPYRAIDKNGSSYTFVFTDEEKELLRDNCADALTKDALFIIRTVIGGNAFTHSLKKTFKIDDDNSNSMRPVVTLTASPVNPSSLPDDLKGKYIQGITKVSVSLTAEFKNNATASEYSVSVEGRTYTGQSITSDILQTTGYLSTGYLTMWASVTDSRGLTGGNSQTIRVFPYTKPHVISASGASAVQCFRANEDGTASAEGEKIFVRAKRQYSPLHYGEDLNTCVLRWRSKAEGDTTFGEWHTLLSAGATGDEFSDIIKVNLDDAIFSRSSAYTVEIGVLDKVGQESSVSFPIPEGAVTVHLKRGGKALGIGRYAGDDNTVGVAWKTLFYDGFTGTSLFPEADDVFAFAESCPNGVTPFLANSGTTNKPTSGSFDFAPGIVFKFKDIFILVYMFDHYDGSVAVCNFFNDTWGEWKYFRPALPTS